MQFFKFLSNYIVNYFEINVFHYFQSVNNHFYPFIEVDNY